MTRPPGDSIETFIFWCLAIGVLLVVGGAVDFVFEPTGSVTCVIGLAEFFAGFFWINLTMDLAVKLDDDPGFALGLRTLFLRY